jgi:hypothetical protein
MWGWGPAQRKQILKKKDMNTAYCSISYLFNDPPPSPERREEMNCGGW